MHRHRNKKNSQDNESGSPAWMTTFSDMMTLLLVFFVLLYSFSVMDLEKFRGFISSFQKQLGVLDGGKTLTDEDLTSRGSQGENFNPEMENYIKEVMGELQQYVEDEGLNEEIDMELNERGFVIRVTGEVLYDLGKAEIKSQGKELLEQIVDKLDNIPNDIRVEGHTDDLPINNDRFPSNWELSTTRATNVIKYFIENEELNPARLSAAGYSEYRPIKENDSPENRTENRRVEIVVLNSSSISNEGGQ
ncbi:MAG: flagellar motor protein MotB [Halanaerobiales bacterium]